MYCKHRSQQQAGRATRGVHDIVGVTLGKSKAIFCLILMLMIRFRLIILDEQGTEEISDSLGDFIFASITDEGIHGSPFLMLSERVLMNCLVDLMPYASQTRVSRPQKIWPWLNHHQQQGCQRRWCLLQQLH